MGLFTEAMSRSYCFISTTDGKAGVYYDPEDGSIKLDGEICKMIREAGLDFKARERWLADKISKGEIIPSVDDEGNKFFVLSH